MKFLKSWSLYLEAIEINDTDTDDIKKAKEKLNTLEKQLSDYNALSIEIDKAYQSDDENKIKEVSKKVFGDTDIKSGEDRNEFLIKHLNVSKKKRDIIKLQKEIQKDDLSKLQSIDIMNNATDDKTKSDYNLAISKIVNSIKLKKDKVSKLQNEINNQLIEYRNDMDSRRKELNDYIKKISQENEK